MKIMIFTGWYPNPIYFEDGLSVRNQAKMFADAGHEVHVVAISLTAQWILRGVYRTRERHTMYYEVQEHRLEGPFLRKRKKLLWHKYNEEAAVFLTKTIQQVGRPDVIHLHNHLAGIAAVRVASKNGVPLVYTEHSTDFLTDDLPNCHKAYLPTLLEASHAAGVSSELASSLQQYGSNQVDTLPNFIDSEIFFPDNHNHSSHDLKLITVSTLIPRKQIDILLHIFAAVCDKYPGATLKIIGYGNEEGSLKRLTNRLGISKSVDFTGALDQRQVASSLRASNLFVSASRLETFGVMYVEALACGLPVIAWDSKGVRDVVKHRFLGAIASDREGLQAEILHFLGHPSNIDRRKIADWAQTHFGKDANITRHTDLYGKLMT